MNMSINFPHLGIYLEHVGKTIEVFGIDIAYYGIVIAVSMIAGVSLILAEAKRTGQDQDFYLNMLMLSIVVGIVGARAYYVAFSWDYYKDNLWEIFNTRGGGMAIYGGILFGVTAACIYTAKKKAHLGKMVDTACLGLVLGQILGRWGNFFNREAFGGYTDNLLAMQLPVDAVRSGEITSQMEAHIQYVQGAAYIQVHPAFLYESMWNILVLVFLLWYRHRKRFQGEVFLMYLAGYGLGRGWIEGLRTDQLKIALGGEGLPVSQLLSIGLAAAGIGAVLSVRYCLKHKRDYTGKKGCHSESDDNREKGDSGDSASGN